MQAERPVLIPFDAYSWARLPWLARRSIMWRFRLMLFTNKVIDGAGAVWVAYRRDPFISSVLVLVFCAFLWGFGVHPRVADLVAGLPAECAGLARAVLVCMPAAFLLVAIRCLWGSIIFQVDQAGEAVILSMAGKAAK